MGTGSGRDDGEGSGLDGAAVVVRPWGMSGAVTVPQGSSPPPWGPPPKGATRWQCHREEGGKWSAANWYEAGANVAGRSWPVGDLSVQLIGARWGAGRYRLTWHGPQRDTGKRLPSLGTSSIFVVDGFPVRPLYPNPPPVEVSASALAGPASSDNPSLLLFREIWTLTQGHHSALLQATVGSHQQMMAWAATMFSAESQRTREHHAAVIDQMKVGASQQFLQVEALVKGLGAQVKELAARLDAEEEEAEEATAEAKAAELSGLERLSKLGLDALEEFGPAAVAGALKKIGVKIPSGDDDD